MWFSSQSNQIVDSLQTFHLGSSSFACCRGRLNPICAAAVYVYTIITLCGSVENHVKPADNIKSFKVCALPSRLRFEGFRHVRGQGHLCLSSAIGRDVSVLGLFTVTHHKTHKQDNVAQLA